MSSQLPIIPIDPSTTLEWEDTPYRDEYRTRYGTDEGYDVQEPAYRHGHHLAGDAVYADRGWDESEADLRTAWESNHPDSPWENFKASVKHAWDRIRG